MLLIRQPFIDIQQLADQPVECVNVVLHCCILILHELIQHSTQEKLIFKGFKSLHGLKYLQQPRGIGVLQVVILDFGCNDKSYCAYRFLLQRCPSSLLNIIWLLLLKCIIDAYLHQIILHAIFSYRKVDSPIKQWKIDLPPPPSLRIFFPTL